MYRLMSRVGKYIYIYTNIKFYGIRLTLKKLKKLNVDIDSRKIECGRIKRKTVRVNHSGQPVSLSPNQVVSLPCTVSGPLQMLSNEPGASDPAGLTTFHRL